MKKLILYAFLSLLSWSSVHAGLTWETKALKVHKNIISDETVSVEFKFINKGPETVFISEVTPGSSNLVPEKGVGYYKSGESGVISFTYYSGDRIGSIVESARIFSSDSPTPIQLNILLTIPAAITVKPEILVWARGDPAVSKQVKLVAMAGGKTKVLQVYSTSTNFTASFHEDAVSGEWIISATPQSTERADRAFIYLDVEMEGKLRKFNISVTVPPPVLATIPEENRPSN